MPELVVVVSRLVERIANPVTQWNLRIGVMTAHHQDDAVRQDQDVRQSRERETLARKPQDYGTDQRRKHLEYPDHIVERPIHRPRQDADENRDPGPAHHRMIHRASPGAPGAAAFLGRQYPLLEKQVQTQGSHRKSAKLNHSAQASIKTL